MSDVRTLVAGVLKKKKKKSKKIKKGKANRSYNLPVCTRKVRVRKKRNTRGEKEKKRNLMPQV